MNNIPTELKLLLFGKDDSEGLSAEEQRSWENSLITVYPYSICLAFLDARNDAIIRLANQKTAAWQKFKNEVLGGNTK